MSLLLEHLLYVHSPDGGCNSFPFPSFSWDLMGTISGSAGHELLRGCRERAGEIWLVWGFSKGVKVERGSDWGFGNFLAD
jgi:hypothetical protein